MMIQIESVFDSFSTNRYSPKSQRTVQLCYSLCFRVLSAFVRTFFATRIRTCMSGFYFVCIYASIISFYSPLCVKYKSRFSWRIAPRHIIESAPSTTTCAWKDLFSSSLRIGAPSFLILTLNPSENIFCTFLIPHNLLQAIAKFAEDCAEHLSRTIEFWAFSESVQISTKIIENWKKIRFLIIFLLVCSANHFRDFSRFSKFWLVRTFDCLYNTILRYVSPTVIVMAFSF